MRTILRILRALVNVQPLMMRDAMYSKEQLDELFGDNPRRFARWKSAGLRPLATGTKAEYFLSNDLFDVWIKLRDEEPTE